MSKFEEFEKNVTRYQELVGYAIPGIFAAVAASCQTRVEGFLALSVMTGMIALTPEWEFIRNFRLRSQRVRTSSSMEDQRALDRNVGMHPVPSLIVFCWLLLIGFGVIR